jgi:glycosyltransferase involved in cell wall biosynthesis
MIAGTPALLSSYSQAEAFIHDGVNGFLFDFDSTDSLISKLSYILHNKTILKKIGVNAQMKAKQFVYANNKDLFLKVLVGNNN